MLEDTWRSEHHATLIQINIDRFKNINDTLGHESANRVLVSLAERLRATAEGFGASVARAGGDDFVVLDGSTRTFDDAHERVERISSVFARPFIVGDSTVFVTASIGVAMAPRNRTITAEELMRRADIATHRAKADGRNRIVVFDDSMQSNLTYRMDVEHALHGAIGRQEMRLYHQPIVDLDTGHLSGFEALIRWQREGVIVPPADFIPIAEETGIINEIGAWALREALCELRRWIDDGVVAPGTTTSVNVSPRQILDPDFAAVVRDALEHSGVPPHLLWLEMTESMMLDEPELAEKHAAPDPGDGRAARARRLRHRLLIAVVAPALPDPADQDRPGLRAGHRRPQQRPLARAHDHRHGTVDGARSRRRGRRDRASVAGPAATSGATRRRAS